MGNLILQMVCMPVLVCAWVLTYRATWLYDVRCRRLILDPDAFTRSPYTGWNLVYWKVWVWNVDKLFPKPQEK